MPRITTTEGISVREFARQQGVDESAIRQAVKNGRLADAVYDDGSIDEVRARVLWLKTRDTSRQKGVAKRASKNAENAAKARGLNDVKFDKLEVDLETARLELSVLKRESIPYSEARRALAAFMRMHRDMSLRFAVRYGPAIAAELGCDEGALIIALSARMREALNEAADNARPFPKAQPAVANEAAEDTGSE